MKTQLNQETRSEYNQDFEKVSVKYFVISHKGRILKDVKCNSKAGRNISAFREYYEQQIEQAEIE